MVDGEYGVLSYDILADPIHSRVNGIHSYSPDLFVNILMLDIEALFY